MDACRNNPFSRRWRRSTGGRGLASVNAAGGTFIAFATAPGKEAEDGGSNNNSPFMPVLNLTIEQIVEFAKEEAS